MSREEILECWERMRELCAHQYNSVTVENADRLRPELERLLAEGPNTEWMSSEWMNEFENLLSFLAFEYAKATRKERAEWLGLQNEPSFQKLVMFLRLSKQPEDGAEPPPLAWRSEPPTPGLYVVEDSAPKQPRLFLARVDDCARWSRDLWYRFLGPLPELPAPAAPQPECLCPISFPHNPHDACDGKPNAAPMFGRPAAPGAEGEGADHV